MSKNIIEILLLLSLVATYIITALIILIIFNNSITLSLILFSFGFVSVVVCKSRLRYKNKKPYHKSTKDEKFEYIGSFVLLIVSVLINIADIIIFIING